MRYIGDVHGKYTQYKKIIDSCKESIQVGDMGVGFRSERHCRPLQNPPHYAMARENHRFIRGNHDNPHVCKNHSQCIPDGTVESLYTKSDSLRKMFVGGGLSIDQQYRHEGLDWWPEEELSIQELNLLIDEYDTHLPEIMVTHDCPEPIARILFNNGEKLEYPSRTRQAFQIMWERYQPDIWIFGHWHSSRDKLIDECRFICLSELEFIDLEI